jgi:hypothetical protein
LGSRNQIKIISFCLCISTGVFAAQLTGTATNGTTKKAAAGDEVVLLSLAGGMDEVAHTKTDAQGHFTINAPDDGAQHLVRVAHQGVNYYRAAPQGTTSVEINVYDSARDVPNILQESRVLRVQTKDGKLEVSEAYTIRNESQPPRTKNGGQTFEVTIPDGAKLQDGMVAGPGGMPTTSMPAAAAKKNHYAFSYAIKPGRSQFQVVYLLPYSGSYEFTIVPGTPVAELGVLLPKSMKFNSAGGKFTQDADESGMAVFLARSIAPAQQMKFSIQGEGSAPIQPQGGMPGQASAPGRSSGPGGGLGAPIDAPDPLGSSRGFIIGGFLVVLAGGAFWLVRKSLAAKPRYENVDGGAVAANPDASKPQAYTAPPSRPAPSGGILDVLKEELFQLESDRLHEKISQQAYETSKAGLDALLRRHVKPTDRT